MFTDILECHRKKNIRRLAIRLSAELKREEAKILLTRVLIVEGNHCA